MSSRAKSLLLATLLLTSSVCYSQSAIVRGEVSAGVYENLRSTGGSLFVNTSGSSITVNYSDPCQSANTTKTSTVVNVTTATTTLIATSTGNGVSICGFSMTISQVVTTANTLKFVRGTGATCGTGTADLTGAYGTGGVTAAAPLVLAVSGAGTLFKSTGSENICVTTTIGASAAFTGVVTYVIQ